MLPVFYTPWGIPVYSYLLFLGASFGYAYYGLRRLLGAADVFRGNLFFMGIFICSWMGSKIVFYGLWQIQNTQLPLHWNTQFLLGGGFVFYGGLGLSILFALFYFRTRWGAPLKQYYPQFLIILLKSHAIGRLGCFAAGCCFGNNLWGVKHFPQLYEALGLMFLAIWGEKRMFASAFFFEWYLASYGLLRIFIEFFRGDEERGIWIVGSIPLSLSQSISIGITSLALLQVAVLKKPLLPLHRPPCHLPAKDGSP